MVYIEIHLQWKAHGHPLACNNALDGSVHETSQTFIRPLSFGRQESLKTQILVSLCSVRLFGCAFCEPLRWILP